MNSKQFRKPYKKCEHHAFYNTNEKTCLRVDFVKRRIDTWICNKLGFKHSEKGIPKRDPSMENKSLDLREPKGPTMKAFLAAGLELRGLGLSDPNQTRRME